MMSAGEIEFGQLYGTQAQNERLSAYLEIQRPAPPFPDKYHPAGTVSGINGDFCRKSQIFPPRVFCAPAEGVLL